MIEAVLFLCKRDGEREGERLIIHSKESLEEFAGTVTSSVLSAQNFDAIKVRMKFGDTKSFAVFSKTMLQDTLEPYKVVKNKIFNRLQEIV